MSDTTGPVCPQDKSQPHTGSRPARKFDVPVVQETEVLFTDIEASCVEEAEKIARRLFDKGERPKDPKLTWQEVLEVGPAVEVLDPSLASSSSAGHKAKDGSD